MNRKRLPIAGAFLLDNISILDVSRLPIFIMDGNLTPIASRVCF